MILFARLCIFTHSYNKRLLGLATPPPWWWFWGLPKQALSVGQACCLFASICCEAIHKVLGNERTCCSLCLEAPSCLTHLEDAGPSPEKVPDLPRPPPGCSSQPGYCPPFTALWWAASKSASEGRWSASVRLPRSGAFHPSLRGEGHVLGGREGGEQDGATGM